MLRMRQTTYRRDSSEFIRQQTKKGKNRYTLVDKFQINQTDYTSIQLAFRNSYFLKHISFA